MKDRLNEIIRYKTGGKKLQFAELMGWTPQYLSKLLTGGNFGLQPLMAVLERFPEINARWLIFGTGNMLEMSMMFQLQREATSHIQSLLDLDRFIPYMTAEEIKEFKEALQTGRKPVFSPSQRERWQQCLTDRENELNAKFSAANAKSDELCRQQIANK